MKAFPCTSCGSCCKRARSISESLGDLDKNDPLVFPFKWDENGVCEKLVDNKCSVYNDRPLLCNADRVAEHMGYSKEKFYPILIDICNRQMDEDGIDEKFRIKEKE